MVSSHRISYKLNFEYTTNPGIVEE
jgi:hypothetical protein